MFIDKVKSFVDIVVICAVFYDRGVVIFVLFDGSDLGSRVQYPSKQKGFKIAVNIKIVTVNIFV